MGRPARAMPVAVRLISPQRCLWAAAKERDNAVIEPQGGAKRLGPTAWIH